MLSRAAVSRPLIRRIDRLIAMYHDKAVEAYPGEPIQQDRWLREKLVEDCPPEKAAAVAMKCDHYLFCLRSNAQATFSS